MADPDDSYTHAIDIPEILHHIFIHLDPPSLDACARVSHFWRSLSLDVSASAFIPSKDALEYFARPKEPESKEGKSTERQELPLERQDPPTAAEGTTTTTSSTDNKSESFLAFCERCPSLRSLTVGDFWNGGNDYAKAFDMGKDAQWECAIPAGLTNLVRLDVRLLCARQPYCDYGMSLPHQLFRKLTSQNPLIEELVYASKKGDSLGYRGLSKALLHSPLPHLRRLSLHLDDHAWEFLEF
ncbi:hypothetical protein BGX29_008558 [Mortierella sp. GBA35]|nr:hypothetical protein BGX29_008558 [Mortierella sp. GBA35]